MTAGPYSKERPKGGRTKIAAGRASTLSSESSALLEAFRPMLEEAVRRRREDSDVRRMPVETGLANLNERLDAQERREKALHDRRMRSVKVWSAAAATILSAAGGIALYLAKTAPPEVEAADVAEQVEDQGEGLREGLREVQDRIDRMEDVAVKQQLELDTQALQVSDGFDWVGAKIDAAHPRQARRVAEPESLKAAKRRAKLGETRERLLGAE